VADFGNVLRHSYFAIDANVVWKIIKESLPPLRTALQALRQSIS